MVAEVIPDDHQINRLIDFPRMYSEAREFIWIEIFTFPDNSGESVVWSKYAPAPVDIHRIGCERETRLRQRRPDFKYEGYIDSQAGIVRGIQSSRGHRFDVVHVPEEGVFHAEIRYLPLDGSPFSRTDKTELKAKLAAQWSELDAHDCQAA